MKNGMMMIGMAAACVALADNVVTNTWNAMTANTPLTAYDYSTAANWSNVTLGAPNGWDAKATFNNVTTPIFVRLPDDLRLSAYSFNNKTYFLGDMTVSGYSAGTGSGSFASDLSNGSILFGDLRNTKIKNTIYMGGHIAGHFRPGKWYEGTGPGYAHTSRFVMRCDLFADDTNPVREGPYHYNGSAIENGGFWLVGPRGAEAQDCAWTLTNESPYLQYAGSGTHGVVPGTTVTGDGIPSETFVRYVFNKSGWIALSKPVTASGTKTLHFSAITPTVRQYWPQYWGHNGGRATAAVKYREQDTCEFYVNQFSYSDPGAQGSGTTWGLDDTMISSGYLPGEIVISNYTVAAAVVYRKNTLQNVHLTFEGSMTEPSADAKPEIYWTFASGKSVAQFTVTRENVLNLGSFKDLKGTLVKRGTGTLGLAMSTAGSSANSGRVKIEAGTLAFTKNTVIAGDELAVATVEIAAGATLKIPSGGMSVVNLKAAEGAKVEGPGTLRVTSTMTGVPVLVGGATLEARTPNVALRSAVLTGLTPWFDLDASDFGSAKMTTELVNGTNFVTRWEDSCGGGHYAVQYLTDNRGGKCWIRPNATNGMPFVDLGPFVCTNFTRPGVLNGPNRALRICPPAGLDPSGKGYFGGNETGVSWGGLAKPSIKAAFFAVSSDNGGGSLLGSEGHSYQSYGLIHGRGGADDPILCFDNRTYTYHSYASNANIDNGTTTFRVNGRSVYPQTEPFSGGYDVITFRGSRFSSILGTFWQSGSGNYENSANGLAYGEVLCFTNTVADAQMVQIENYLQYKWYGRRMPGAFYEGAVWVEQGSTLNVSAGADGTVVAMSLGGCGTVAGNVDLAETGVFKVEVDTEGVPVTDLTVNGRVRLPAVASVAFSGEAPKLKTGTYTLLTATTCEGSASAWTFAATAGRQCYRMTRDGNTLKLTVLDPGTQVIFR